MTISKVLIVEDEKDIQLIAQIGLVDIGNMEVQIANDGQEAIDKLQQWRPDLILMDVMMPNKSGSEALVEIKRDENLKDIPIIIMTAKSENEQVENYKQLGALEVIIKPFDPVTLSQRLIEICNKG